MDCRDTGRLRPSQIEEYIEKLECINVEDILSERWMACGCSVVRLGVEAAVQSGKKLKETVHLAITTKEKGMPLVWLLLSCEMWRIQLLPLLLPKPKKHKDKEKKQKEEEEREEEEEGKEEKEEEELEEEEEEEEENNPAISSLPFITVLQTEAAALGLLEGLVYEEGSAASLEGLLLDLIDYCVRQLVPLAALPRDFTPSGTDKRSGSVVDEVWREENRMVLVVACRSISVIHLLAACLKKLPLCATSRMLGTHDVPQLMAQLLETAPFRTECDGERKVFEDGEWKVVGEDGPPLSRTECQAWATLAYLLLDPETLSSYDLNSLRRAALLRLRPRLHPGALAQVPALESMARWLAQLAIVPIEPARPPPLITTLTQVGEAVRGNWDGRWEELARNLKSRFLQPDSVALRNLATGLSTAWDLDSLEQLLPDPPTCGVCGAPAGRRCSRCRSQWYCRRECQVQDWKKHQRICYIICPSSSTS